MPIHWRTGYVCGLDLPIHWQTGYVFFLQKKKNSLDCLLRVPLDAGSTQRSQGGDKERTRGLYRGEMDFQIADRVVEVAEKLGHAPAQVAVAWLMSKPEVTAPVVGVSRPEQLDQLVEAASLSLSAEEVAYLEELYKPVENLLSIGSS